MLMEKNNRDVRCSAWWLRRTGLKRFERFEGFNGFNRSRFRRARRPEADRRNSH
jgi:hypothetical protein